MLIAILTASAAPFGDTSGMLAAIDSIKVGDAPWESFACNPIANVPAGAPEWMKKEYIVFFRDIDQTIQNLLANPDFAGEFDYVPYREYDSRGDLNYPNRRYCDFFSGDWAWRQAVRPSNCNASKTLKLIFINLGHNM